MASKFDDEISPNLTAMQRKVSPVVKMYMSSKVPIIDSYMKVNRPWTDRTNLAKLTLRARQSSISETKERITVAHGVSYGIWLELANEKKYSILKPTIDKFKPEIVSDLRYILFDIVD